MMDERSIKNGVSPQLLNLIQNQRSEWNRNSYHHNHHQKHMRSSQGGEERKLELSLAPPGGGVEEEDWSINHSRTNKNLISERDESSLLSLGGYFPHHATNNRGSSSFLHQFPSSISSPSSQPQKDASSSQAAPCCTQVITELFQNNNDNNNAEKKKVFSSSSPSSSTAAPNTAVPNTYTSQKRTAPGPVVGWPPIRSFRKNLASSSSSKPPSPPPPEPCSHQQQNHHHNNSNKKLLSGKKHAVENNYGKGMFVKINMDGVPIGRKVDLNAYDSYENLSNSVDELFRGLLAAQRDSSAGGVNKKKEEEKPITGLLDGSGEYTLVYEDNEGDRMLVGDVPWHMFVSTVKRLRVLKTTELSAFTLGGKQEKETT